MTEATATPLRVLLVEDSEIDATLVERQLRRCGYSLTVRRVETDLELRRALREETWDLVLSDYQLPHFSGLEALRVVQDLEEDLPFIIVTGAIGEDTAAAVMRAGAHDYVMKGALARLCPAIERERREATMRRERRRAAAGLQEDNEVTAALHLIGRGLIASLNSPTLLVSLCEMTARVLRCDSSHTLFWQPNAQVFRPIANFGATAEEDAVARATAVPRSMMRGLLARFQHDDVTEISPTAVDLLCTPEQRASMQLCIALRCGTELIGIQVASRRESLTSFGNFEYRIGRGIAQLASLALEHARVRQELEQSNRLKSDFVGTMSHELRTPLNIILGYTDLLSEGEFGRLSGDQSEVVGRIQHSAGDLLEMVDAMLDLSRLERGLAPVDIEPIALDDWLEEIGLGDGAHGIKREAPVRIRLARGLPTLYTDPVKLKVIVRNLVGNALKFTDHGEVTLSARPHRGGVEIAVSDTGPGIPPEMLPVIFEPFRQVGDVDTAHVPGVGLGLYIVRKLLDLLGGAISVESTVGIGSTFRVLLPRALPQSEPFRQRYRRVGRVE